MAYRYCWSVKVVSGIFPCSGQDEGCAFVRNRLAMISVSFHENFKRDNIVRRKLCGIRDDLKMLGITEFQYGYGSQEA